MVKWPNGQMVRCQMVKWSNGQMVKWSNGQGCKMVKWSNGQMVKWSRVSEVDRLVTATNPLPLSAKLLGSV